MRESASVTIRPSLLRVGDRLGDVEAPGAARRTATGRRRRAGSRRRRRWRAAAIVTEIALTPRSAGSSRNAATAPHRISASASSRAGLAARSTRSTAGGRRIGGHGDAGPPSPALAGAGWPGRAADAQAARRLRPVRAAGGFTNCQCFHDRMIWYRRHSPSESHNSAQSDSDIFSFVLGDKERTGEGARSPKSGYRMQSISRLCCGRQPSVRDRRSPSS